VCRGRSSWGGNQEEADGCSLSSAQNCLLLVPGFFVDGRFFVMQVALFARRDGISRAQWTKSAEGISRSSSSSLCILPVVHLRS
jgi:hypothetical protein